MSAQGQRFDAVVVGSGPNGLTAAITLADAGLAVLVLEGAPTLGGGARTAPLTLPGFRHDVCSAIHPMALASPAFQGLNLAEHGLRWIHPGAPLAHPLDEGRAVMLERGVAATAAGLDQDGPAYIDFVRPWLRRWPDLVDDALAPLRPPRHPVLMARFGAQALRSATALARSTFRGRRARALFAGLAAHSVLPLERSPSAAIGIMLGVAAHAGGWPLPAGGAQALSDALASRLRAAGGTLRTDSPVHDISQIPTDGPILFETSPAALADIAGDALPASFRQRLRRYRHGPGVCKVDYALDGPIPWAAAACARAGTVHLGGDLDEISDGERAAWEGRDAASPFVLVAQQSLFDPTRAPAGRHTAWAYCHVPSGSDEDVGARIDAQIERFAPGFAQRILARHVRTARGYEAYNPTYVGGDVNGGAPTLDQLQTRPVVRPTPYTTPNPRLFLCSSSTPPGGGVHGMCGLWAARAALAEGARDKGSPAWTPRA